MGFSFGERTKSDDSSAKHIDFEANRLHAIEVCARDREIPAGLTLFTSDKYFGVSYTHPYEAYGHATGAAVKFNQPKEAFIKESDKACFDIYHLAKKTNKLYGIHNIKSKRVHECEKTMIDGKCACGYTANRANLTVELRSKISQVSRGIYIKDAQNEDDEVLW